MAAQEVQIRSQAALVRERRDVLKKDGKAWREDGATMEAAFELMRLKFAHPTFRHETLPEGVTDVTIKLRWKVVGKDGKPVVLQRPFRQVTSVAKANVLLAVAAYTAKRVPGVAPFHQVLVVNKDGRRCELPEELRLNMVFPGPKFEPVRMVKLECVNEAYEAYVRAKPERAEAQAKRLAEDKARVEARKLAKHQARAAAVAAQAPAGPVHAGRGRGRGRGAKKAGKKAGAKGVAVKGRGRGH